MTYTRVTRISFCIMVFWVNSVRAAPVIVVGTDNGPPHMIEHNVSGIDIDITRLLLDRIGLKAEFKFVGLGRARFRVKSQEFDAMVPAFIQTDEVGFYVSTPIIRYLPTVFSLAKKHLDPQRLEHIKGHTLASFQGAVGFFGEDFRQLTLASPYYIESSNMRTIPSLIFKDRFDYAVLDKYIFYYYFRLDNKQRDITVFKEHDLIPRALAGVGFSDKALRDRFNLMAKDFLSSDEYRKIVTHYIGSFN